MCPDNERASNPSSTLQIFTTASAPPETIRELSGENTKALIDSVAGEWAAIWLLSCQSLTRQMRIWPLSSPVASNVPSGEKANFPPPGGDTYSIAPATAPSAALKIWIGPLGPAVATRRPSGENATDVTMLS